MVCYDPLNNFLNAARFGFHTSESGTLVGKRIGLEIPWCMGYCVFDILVKASLFEGSIVNLDPDFLLVMNKSALS